MLDLAQVEALFHEARLMPAGPERCGWLAAECGSDLALLQEVSTLLDACERLSQTVGEMPVLPLAQFGPYRPVRLLGRGGMSAVYLAERADGQFEQVVALKVMAGYLAGPEFSRRFQRERQFLASLNHPHITRLLDGGVSSAGDPFLITEYVEGETIDRYCERRTLPVEERIRFFLQVCDAVGYAHRHLIVHGDLKPANILVDNQGCAKLLDFGAAVLAEGRENPTITRTHLLTPRYASPEQLRGEHLTIATDIFSLAVILYELLSGAWPFGDPASLDSALMRSTGRVSAKPLSAAITSQAAQTRGASLPRLRRVFKGDLSSVLLKALHPSPQERYHSVSALAADLENSLSGRPVSARPQTAWYSVQKFILRHRLPVAAAAVGVALLSAAVVIDTREARRARAEALRAENVNRFLNDILSSSAQQTFNPKTFTVVQMLQAAEGRLQRDRNMDLATQATLHFSLGTSYVALMQFDQAQKQLESALRGFEKLHDETQIARTLYYMAANLDEQGRSEEALRGFEQVLDRLKGMGDRAPPQLVFSTKQSLATVLFLDLHRRIPEAEKFLVEAIALGERDSSIPRTMLADALGSRALILQDQGKAAAAEALYRRALAIGRQQDPGGLWQATPLLGLATLVAPRDPAGAAELSHERYRIFSALLGPDNPQAAVSQILWIRQRTDAHELGDGAEQVLKAMEVVRRTYLASSMDRWFALSSSTHVLNRAGRYDEAESLAREMFPILEANHLAANDPRRAESLFELGVALRGLKKNREARQALTQSAVIYDTCGPDIAVMAQRARNLVRRMEGQ